MDFGNRSSNETGNGGLLDNVDPHMREVVKVACQELPLPKLPVVPARANREHAIGLFGKKEVDEAVEPSDEYIRDALHPRDPSTGGRAINKPQQSFTPATDAPDGEVSAA